MHARAQRERERERERESVVGVRQAVWRFSSCSSMTQFGPFLITALMHSVCPVEVGTESDALDSVGKLHARTYRRSMVA